MVCIPIDKPKTLGASTYIFKAENRNSICQWIYTCKISNSNVDSKFKRVICGEVTHAKWSSILIYIFIASNSHAYVLCMLKRDGWIFVNGDGIRFKMKQNNYIYLPTLVRAQQKYGKYFIYTQRHTFYHINGVFFFFILSTCHWSQNVPVQTVNNSTQERKNIKIL